MTQSYVALLVYLVVALALAVVLSFASQWLGPRHPGAVKALPYESGIVPEAPVGYFSVRFYRVAMFFLVFDVAVVALYPWATALRHLGLPGLLRGLGFLVVVVLAFAYAWKRGGFRWD
ncbi:NADH:quinone oxidoreductase subunit A [Candidatus Hydrogenisulfobacillus filiaventi]|uniref:NADH-quinone oxidoreductase subunit A n=1 Tax=Candidatus Hydrogenisulfobacillus filiaventi TaxID=2707344 RepID=A0A6F8ZHZ6_9FIRM|nr:NADH-quinone oxidoreductase subunit A [Bacillota bacterium]CAB1129343.1 NADH:quinone oxidoreductase subunit A [Candidatus Hydrogenisulfobacillus filiaventi]